MTSEMVPTLRIVTQTVNRSLETAEALKALAIKEGIDVVIMHAPPIYDGDIPGYGSSICIITGVEDDEDVMPQSAVAIFNESLQLTSIPEMSDDTCICLQLMTDIGEIYLIGVYCPLKMNIISCLDKLQELLQFIGEKHVILCIDASAKSVWWSNSDNTDDRGEILEDFIIANNLCVINHRDPLGEHYRRDDYTDVTLASSNVMQKFTAWHAADYCTSDETRTVAMEVVLKNYSNSLDSFHINEEREEDHQANDDNSEAIVDNNGNETPKNPRDDITNISLDETFPSESFNDKPEPANKAKESLSEVRKEPDVKPSSMGSTTQWQED